MAVTVTIASLTRPIANESVCGDRCAWWLSDSRLILAVVDGLGHGIEAAFAANKAVECIAQHPHAGCEELFQYCDLNLHSTRGAAMAIAIVDLNTQAMDIASVGNIRNVLIQDNGVFRLGGARGIVGAGYEYLAPETVQLFPNALLVMYTDGLNEAADLRPYYRQYEVAVDWQAQAIMEEWQSGLDDVGVLVYRHRGLADFVA